MKRDPVATYLVERVPGQGYQATAQAGSRAEKLSRHALEVLDLTGRLAPSGPPRIDAWLGPFGARGWFVRMLVERTASGEARYRQAWYSRWRLPRHPATIDLASLMQPSGAPSPPSSALAREFRPDRAILAAIQAAAATGRPQTIDVADHDAALACAAMITLRCRGREVHRVTWITHANDAAPFHVRMRQPTAGAHAPAPTADPGEVHIERTMPVLPGRPSFWRISVPLPASLALAGAAAAAGATIAWKLANYE